MDGVRCACDLEEEAACSVWKIVGRFPMGVFAMGQNNTSYHLMSTHILALY